MNSFLSEAGLAGFGDEQDWWAVSSHPIHPLLSETGLAGFRDEQDYIRAPLHPSHPASLSILIRMAVPANPVTSVILPDTDGCSG